MYKDFRCSELNKNEMKNDTCERPMTGVVCAPIMECPEERVCHREICHEVPQD